MSAPGKGSARGQRSIPALVLGAVLGLGAVSMAVTDVEAQFESGTTSCGSVLAPGWADVMGVEQACEDVIGERRLAALGCGLPALALISYGAIRRPRDVVRPEELPARDV